MISSEEIASPGIVPIPVSVDDGKTLDWSQSHGDEATTLIPLAVNSAVSCKSPVTPNGPRTRTNQVFVPLDDKKLSKIRLNVPPKTLEAATKVAGDLRKRYDLLFFHLGTSKPARLTAVARWAISVSKIPPHAWKASIPTLIIEEYLSKNTGNNSESSPPIQTKDWKRVVGEFVSKCDELDQMRGRRLPGLPPIDDRRRGRSRASSGASSISEGHVSPDDDGPSRKVLRYDD